jgi:hypothetical protein
MSPASEVTCQQAGTKRSFARYRLLRRIRPTLAETRLPIIRMGAGTPIAAAACAPDVGRPCYLFTRPREMPIHPPERNAGHRA